ncbi:hypothetical protein EYC59_03555 [Candidatus Saccharibacteria bacterium]|nr:MAG: hypothetical protein EYC59_03555 [Candidatus Saccharibacteria bacterium]
MNQHVSHLMKTEVSRKEFLGMSGLAVASIFGFGAIVKLLTGKSLVPQKPMNNGYGSSGYGR